MLVVVTLGIEWRCDGLEYGCGASWWTAGRPVSSSLGPVAIGHIHPHMTCKAGGTLPHNCMLNLGAWCQGQPSGREWGRGKR